MPALARDSVSLFNATSLYLQWRNNTTDDWLHIPYACSIDPNAVNYNNREHICSSKIDQTIIFSINMINIKCENELNRDGQFGENVVQYQVIRVVRRSKVNIDRWEVVLRKYRTIFCCSCWLEMVKERKGDCRKEWRAWPEGNSLQHKRLKGFRKLVTTEKKYHEWMKDRVKKMSLWKRVR